jgi:hypothetical protein
MCDVWAIYSTWEAGNCRSQSALAQVLEQVKMVKSEPHIMSLDSTGTSLVGNCPTQAVMPNTSLRLAANMAGGPMSLKQWGVAQETKEAKAKGLLRRDIN